MQRVLGRITRFPPGASSVCSPKTASIRRLSNQMRAGRYEPVGLSDDEMKMRMERVYVNEKDMARMLKDTKTNPRIKN